jgi:hypothetical protein
MSMTENTDRNGLAGLADQLERELGGNGNGAEHALAATAQAMPPAEVDDDARLSAGPPPIGVEAGRAIAQCCEAAADDIENAALALQARAMSIVEEARQIAAGVRARGERIKAQVEDFTELTKRLAFTMRDARDRIIGDTAH